jgi:hypothetical protein
MTLRFQAVCSFVSVLCLVLASVWLIFPDLLLNSWGLEHTSSAGVVGRRLAALFLGLSFMMVKMRAAPPSPCSTAMADGFALSCIVLAVLGLVELWFGRVGPGIGLAVISELLVAWALVVSVRSEPQSSF